MSLLNVLKNMSEGFPKTQITDDLNVLRQEIATSTLPMFELLDKEFGSRTFKSKWYENFHKSLKNNVRKVNSKNFITPTYKALEKIQERLDMLEKLVDDNFNDDVSIHAMNVKRINILSYIEACTFFTTYARRLAHTVLAIEINACSDDIPNELDDVLPYNLQWLKERRDSWFLVLDIFLNGKGDLNKVVDDLPDLSVNKTNIKAVEVLHRDLDPFGFGFIPVVLNPAYHIGIMLAEWQVNRLNTAIAEKDVLEVQVMNLKLLAQDKNDAKLQGTIKYMEEERLKPLYKKIGKMEEKYGGS